MCVGALVLVICDPAQRSTLLYMIPFMALCYAGYYASAAWRKRHGAGQGDGCGGAGHGGEDHGPRDAGPGKRKAERGR